MYCKHSQISTNFEILRYIKSVAKFVPNVIPLGNTVSGFPVHSTILTWDIKLTETNNQLNSPY